MSKKKPVVVVTRKLPDAIETRMMELFDTRLNHDDTPMSQTELAKAASEADVLVPTVTDKIDLGVLSNANPDLDIAALMARATPILTPEEAAAYAAPFPNQSYKAGVRRFPNLVPDNPDAGGAATSRRARDWWGAEWNGQTFMAIGMQDPVLGASAMRALANQIKGCPPPLEIEEAGHFVQEWGEQVAQQALEAFA